MVDYDSTGQSGWSPRMDLGRNILSKSELHRGKKEWRFDRCEISRQRSTVDVRKERARSLASNDETRDAIAFFRNEDDLARLDRHMSLHVMQFEVSVNRLCRQHRRAVGKRCDRQNDRRTTFALANVKQRIVSQQFMARVEKKRNLFDVFG